MKAQELRDQSVEELQVRLEELQKKGFELRNERQVHKKLEHPHEMAQTRREIARVLTVLNEKQSVATGAE